MLTTPGFSSCCIIRIADQTGQTSGTVVVIRQADGRADGKQPCHVIDQCAACLDQQEADGVSRAGSCCTGNAHNARSKGITKTHQDAADRQHSDGKHQSLAQFLEILHHKDTFLLKECLCLWRLLVESRP